MSWEDLVRAAEGVRAAAIEREPRLRAAPLAAIGWATVDHERAEQELDGLLARDAAAPVLESWVAIDRDPALGAAAWQRAPGPTSGTSWSAPSLVLLEPDTEGRVAAFLARFGEGVGVVYLGAGPGQAGELVRGGPAWGPHVVFEAPR